MVDSNKNYSEAILFQSIALLSPLMLNIQYRYIPDRLLILCVFILVTLLYRFLADQKSQTVKNSIYTGIIAAIGITTKIYFLPLVFLPLFVFQNWKQRFIFFGSTLLSSAIILIPIYRKLEHFKTFSIRVASHDGLYGGGESRFLNPDVFFENTNLVIKSNLLFFILLGTLLISSLYIISRKKLRLALRKELILSGGILIVVTLCLVIISKHYKNYYVLPMISLAGLVAILVLRIFREILPKVVVRGTWLGMCLLAIGLTMAPLTKAISSQHQRTQRNAASSAAFKELVSATDFLLIDPDWKSSPFQENALMYGISYAGRHHLLYNKFESLYPYVLSYEGDDREIYRFRMIPGNNETILKSGKDLYIYSAPGRRAQQMLNYLDRDFSRFEIEYACDTIYSNPTYDEYLIRVRNLGSWKIVDELACGFEKNIDAKLFSDDGIHILNNQQLTLSGKAINGNSSVALNKEQKATASIEIGDIEVGDLLELSVKVSSQFGYQQSDYSFTIAGSSADEFQESGYAVLEDFLSIDIERKWRLYRYVVSIESAPLKGSLSVNFIYKGENNIVVDDLKCIQYRDSSKE